MEIARTGKTDAFWRSYAAAASCAGDHYVVVAFGDGPALASELAALVAGGRKRATCSLLRTFAAGAETMPRVGDRVVVVDGEGNPVCIFRTVAVEVKPFIAVDDRFAWDEGEGERTRDGWLEAHRGYFRRRAAREGFEFHDRIEAVFERFEVVWPPDLADRPWDAPVP